MWRCIAKRVQEFPRFETCHFKSYRCLSVSAPASMLATPRPAIDHRFLATPHLHQHILDALKYLLQTRSTTHLETLLSQLSDHANKAVPHLLPYTPTPEPGTRGHELEGIVNVINVVKDWMHDGDGLGGIVISTGWMIHERVVCGVAHTFDEIAPIVPHPRKSFATTLILSRDGTIYPVQSIASSLPFSDLVFLVLDAPLTKPTHPLAPLPVSPYPPPVGTSLQTYVHSERRWLPSRVLGYKDAIGSKAETGTYDHLSTLLVTGLVPPGSSGGPILDPSGAVCGISRGTVKTPTALSQSGHTFATPAERLWDCWGFEGGNL